MLVQGRRAGLVLTLLALGGTAGCQQVEPPSRLQTVFVDLTQLEEGLRLEEPRPPITLQPFRSKLSAAHLSPLPEPLAAPEPFAPALSSPIAPVLDAADARLQQLAALLRQRAERIIERELLQEQRLAAKVRMEGLQRLSRDQAVAEAQHQSDLRSVRTRHGARLLALEGTLRRVTADPEAVERITAQISTIQQKQAEEEMQARFRNAQRRTANAESYQEFVSEAEAAAAIKIERRAAELRADADKALAEHRAAVLATTRDWAVPAETDSQASPVLVMDPQHVHAPAVVRYKSWQQPRARSNFADPVLEQAKRSHLRLRALAEGRAAGWDVTFEKGQGHADRTSRMVELLR